MLGVQTFITVSCTCANFASLTTEVALTRCRVDVLTFEALSSTALTQFHVAISTLRTVENIADTALTLGITLLAKTPLIKSIGRTTLQTLALIAFLARRTSRTVGGIAHTSLALGIALSPKGCIPQCKSGSCLLKYMLCKE